MEKDKRWIYLLKDPRNGDKKYVGMTKCPHKRLKDHIYKSKFENTKKGRWINKLKTLGLTPIMEILRETTINECSYWEEFFIKKLIEEGHVLLNYDEKGVGTSSKLNDNIIKIKKELSIKIFQYDLHGKLINEFTSLREAERKTGINHGNISKCCNGIFKHSGGFIFKKFNYGGSIEPINKPNAIKKIIIEVDVNGHYINEFNSISEASKITKIDASSISRVCSGKIKKTNNRYFKIKKDE